MTIQNDKLRVYGVVRCLEIISEASRRLSNELRSRHPEIGWAQIAAAGNIYRHEYEAVLSIYIWRTLENDLDPLLTVIHQELGP